MAGFEAYALVPEQGVVPKMEQLDSEMRQRICGLAARIDLADAAQVSGFGARAQKEMGTFSDLALHQMLSRDVDPLSTMMQELRAQIQACSFASEAKGVFARMLGRTPSLAKMRAAYDQAEPRISALCNEMTDRLVALMRDGAMLERIYERNESLYRELCSLIVVGEEALRMARERGEDAHFVARMERRVENIRVTQLSSTQLAAQIRMVQGSDSVTCEKLKTAIDVTIPLWKSQMAAALGLARATDAMRMQSRMNAEAARGVRRSAKEMRAQTAAYAGAAAEDDRIRAQQTAEALLEEIEAIEKGLREKSALERSV